MSARTRSFGRLSPKVESTGACYERESAAAKGIEVEEIEHLLSLSEESMLPTGECIRYFVYASDMASRGQLFEEAIRLAEEALRKLQEAEPNSLDKGWQLDAFCALLRGYHGKGNLQRKEEIGQRIQHLLSAWEKAAPEISDDIRGCYNIASRAFVVTQDWDRAIETSKRATELWDFGPNHWFLAQALWAGRKDRTGTLNALRDAARDARLSGIGQCRNLRDDFLNSSVFADVRDDPEFLEAIEVRGIVEQAALPVTK